MHTGKWERDRKQARQVSARTWQKLGGQSRWNVGSAGSRIELPGNVQRASKGIGSSCIERPQSFGAHSSRRNESLVEYT